MCLECVDYLRLIYAQFWHHFVTAIFLVLGCKIWTTRACGVNSWLHARTISSELWDVAMTTRSLHNYTVMSLIPLITATLYIYTVLVTVWVWLIIIYMRCSHQLTEQLKYLCSCNMLLAICVCMSCVWQMEITVQLKNQKWKICSILYVPSNI